MAYKFKLDEPIAKGFRRIAREQIARALNDLGQDDLADKGVHESRKTMKRLRALLRMVRPQIGEKTFKARNAGLRNAGQMLSGQRESKVLSETIAKLEAHVEADASQSLARFKHTVGAMDNAAPNVLSLETATTLRALLEKEGRRIDKLKFKSAGFDVLAPGLQLSYDKGRRVLAKAYKSPSDQKFHDLRKTVQWHWRHMALLSRAWPEYFEVRIHAARELSQLLGDDHDLAMLQAAVKSIGKTTDTGYRQVIRLARGRQEELRADCFERARRIFAEPHEDFVRRIEIYWNSGRSLRPVTGPVEPDSADPEPPVAQPLSSAPR